MWRYDPHCVRLARCRTAELLAIAGDRENCLTSLISPTSLTGQGPGRLAGAGRGQNVMLLSGESCRHGLRVRCGCVAAGSWRSVVTFCSAGILPAGCFPECHRDGGATMRRSRIDDFRLAPTAATGGA